MSNVEEGMWNIDVLVLFSFERRTIESGSFVPVLLGSSHAYNKIDIN